MELMHRNLRENERILSDPNATDSQMQYAEKVVRDLRGIFTGIARSARLADQLAPVQVGVGQEILPNFLEEE